MVLEVGVTEVVLEDDPAFYTALGGLHKDGPMQQCEQLTWDQFLATKVLKLGLEILTIANLITISANVLGGVHKGDPQDAKEKAVIAFNKCVTVGGQAISAAKTNHLDRVGGT